jgi:hypothetical protein
MKNFKLWLNEQDAPQQYTVHSQSFNEKPAFHHNIEADSIHIRSITTLKQTIQHSIQSKPYYSEFLIEIIESKEAGQKSLIVEISAKVNAQNEQQAKAIVTRDVMSAVGKFSKDGNLQKLLNMKDFNNRMTATVENQNTIIPIKIKLQITENGIKEI